MRRLIRGLLAGAAGTTALNAVTYLDMAVRGRPASSTPRESVQRLADLADVDLAVGLRSKEDVEHRTEALGALLGYATGLGVAAVYAVLGPRRLPRPLATLLLGGAAMAAANGALVATRVTDPRTWSTSDWLSDAVPHLAYGAVAAATLEGLDRDATR